eukprot:gene4971-2377_t
MEMNRITEKFLDMKEVEEWWGCMNWPGVASRWKQFTEFIEEGLLDQSLQGSPEDIFQKFSRKLGRVRSYRALSLTEAQMQKIKDEDTIWPTGRLKKSKQEVEDLVWELGAWNVSHARLYI